MLIIIAINVLAVMSWLRTKNRTSLELDINDPLTFSQLFRGGAFKDMLEANKLGLNEGLLEFDGEEDEEEKEKKKKTQKKRKFTLPKLGFGRTPEQIEDGIRGMPRPSGLKPRNKEETKPEDMLINNVHPRKIVGFLRRKLAETVRDTKKVDLSKKIMVGILETDDHLAEMVYQPNLAFREYSVSTLKADEKYGFSSPTTTDAMRPMIYTHSRSKWEIIKASAALFSVITVVTVVAAVGTAEVKGNFHSSDTSQMVLTLASSFYGRTLTSLIVFIFIKLLNIYFFVYIAKPTFQSEFDILILKRMWDISTGSFVWGNHKQGFLFSTSFWLVNFYWIFKTSLTPAFSTSLSSFFNYFKPESLSQVFLVLLTVVYYFLIGGLSIVGLTYFALLALRHPHFTILRRSFISPLGCAQIFGGRCFRKIGKPYCAGQLLDDHVRLGVNKAGLVQMVLHDDEPFDTLEAEKKYVHPDFEFVETHFNFWIPLVLTPILFMVASVVIVCVV
jgi:hypothetical protein